MYVEHDTLPAWRPWSSAEHAPPVPDAAPPETPLAWSGKDGHAVPPSPGATVHTWPVGKAEVVRYFGEDGYLGVLVRPFDPPAWFTAQNAPGTLAHIFGAELRSAEAR